MKMSKDFAFRSIYGKQILNHQHETLKIWTILKPKDDICVENTSIYVFEWCKACNYNTEKFRGHKCKTQTWF